MLLFVSLQYFYADRHVSVVDDNRMAIIVPPRKSILVHFQKKVLDADFSCLQKGVRAGSSLAEARAILHNHAEYYEWKEEFYQSSHHKWLSICHIFTDEIESISQHEAFLDISRHPQPEKIALDLSDALIQAGFHPRIGLARVGWIAKLQSEIVKDISDSASLDSAYLTPRRFLAPLPIGVLPVDKEIVKRLLWLGYSTVGELTDIPYSALKAQFGDAAYELRRFALGHGDTRVNTNFPEPSVSAYFQFEGSPETTDVIENGLSTLAEILAKKLQEKDLCGHLLRLRLEYECTLPCNLERTFTKPITASKGIFIALKLLISKAHFENLVALSGLILDLKPVQRAQFSLQGRNNPEAQAILSKQVVSTLHKTFGEQSITLGETSNPRTLFLRRFKDAVKWK